MYFFLFYSILNSQKFSQTNVTIENFKYLFKRKVDLDVLQNPEPPPCVAGSTIGLQQVRRLELMVHHMCQSNCRMVQIGFTNEKATKILR